MAVIYLVRHSEPQMRGVFLGRLDPPLSCAGCEQARTLGGLEVDLTYCSPQLRARETAAYVRSERIVEAADLREIDYGLWTGKTWAEIEAAWPEMAVRKSMDWLGVTPPEGESWAQLRQRVSPIAQAILGSRARVAVVAHQGVNAALASLIDGRNPLDYSQRYGEVICVEGK